MVPFLDVSHLPSSASFYSSILQPLGLRYTASEPDDSALAPQQVPSIAYGAFDAAAPILQIRHAPDSTGRVKLSRIVIAAPSALAVADFYAIALRANPAASVTDYIHSSNEDGSTQARISDFDGNIMEVVYNPPARYPSGYNGTTVRRTQSTHQEVGRILDWNYDVATSSAGSSPSRAPLTMARRPAQVPDDEPYTYLRRSATTPNAQPSPRQSYNPNGLSTSAVVGTLLGVAAAGAAAGAAITYNIMKNERARAPRQEFDAPMFQRRSTLPNRLPSEHSQGRFRDAERSIGKLEYPGDYPPVAASSHYTARYSRPGSVARNYAYDDLHDDDRGRRSHVSTRSIRSRSEAAEGRAPLMILDREYSSRAGSRHGASTTRSSHRPAVEPERDSFVSARSHHSSSTIRGPPAPPPLPSEIVRRSRSRSRVTTVKTSSNAAMAFPPNASRTHSLVSARNVPLPPSRAGSSHARWNDDDDADSVAPSDSISCAGSRRSRRSYR